MTARRRIAAATATLVAATAALAGGAAPAAAAAGPVTSLTMFGSGFGLPKNVHLTPDNAYFTVHGNARWVSFDVDVEGGGGATAQFRLPEGQTFAPGTYVDPTDASDDSVPELTLSLDSQSCNAATGRFTVLDAAFGADGKLTRFWAAYEHHCGTAESSIIGEVRYAVAATGDVVLANAATTLPDTYPGRTSEVPVWVTNYAATPVAVGPATFSGAGAAAFRVVSTTCGTLAAGATCEVRVGFAPTTPGAAYAATMALPAGTGTETATFGGRAVPGRTLVAIRSEAGDYVGNGGSYDFTPVDSAFGAGVNTAYNGGTRIWVGAANPATGDDVSVDLRTPGTPMVAGTTYTDAGDASNAPSLSVSGWGRGCGMPVGTFTVHDVAYTPGSPYLERLVLTFDQRCLGANEHLRGSVEWRAPLDRPSPDVTSPASVTGFTVTPGAGTATLSWNASVSPDVERYVVRVKQGDDPASGPFSGAVAYSGLGTSATVGGLLPGVTYTFAIWAVDAARNPSEPGVQTLYGSALTLDRPAPVVVYGERIGLAVRLTSPETGNPVAGAAVTLLHRPRGAAEFTTLATVTTGADGRATLPTVPRANVEYAATWPGSGNVLGVTTGPAGVLVRTRLTSALSATTIARTGAARLVGRVAPNHGGQRVYLQRFSAGAWRTVASTVLTATSGYAFRLAPGAAGTYTYRVVKTADADHVTGYAPARTLTVT